MSVADEIEALASNLQAINSAIVAKGGAPSTSGFSGIATGISSIPSGGGGNEDWGTVTYYDNVSTNFSYQSEGVTVNSIDYDKVQAFVKKYPWGGQSGGGMYYNANYADFSYDDIGMSGNFIYNAQGGLKIYLSTNQLKSEVGIDMSGSYGGVGINLSLTIDKTHTATASVISGRQFESMSFGSNTAQMVAGASETSIYASQIKEYVFGEDCAGVVPNYFLANCPNLEKFSGEENTSITEIGDYFCYKTSVPEQTDVHFDIPTLTKVGTYFFAYDVDSGNPASLDFDIYLGDSSLESIGDRCLYYRDGAITNFHLSGSNFSIGSYFCYHPNHSNVRTSIEIEGIEDAGSIGRGFMYANPSLATITSGGQDVDTFNASSIGADFLYDCDAYNPNVAELSFPNLTTVSDRFLTAYNQPAAKFNVALSLPNVVTVGSSFLSNQGAFNQPLLLPEVTTISSGFMSGCKKYDQPDLPSMPKLQTAGALFLNGWGSWNKDIRLPQTLTSLTTPFQGWNSMTSIIDVGDLPATICSADTSWQFGFFYAQSGTAGATTGPAIKGSTRADWIARYPAKTYSNQVRPTLRDAGE